MTSTSSGSGTYLYDGEGRRVRKTWTPGGGAAQDTYYVYDIAGKLAAEYGTGSNTAAATVYPFTDMLGSVRAVTDATGAVIECYDYLPFGRLLSAADNERRNLGCHPPNPDTSLDSEVSQKFTGQVRDEETRLDYFGARYMSAPQGRFLIPDPLMASAKTTNPQSWNRYIYTLNNPLRYVDPDGLDVPAECVEDTNCAIVVNLNVIYDSTVNNGQGFTNEQKSEFKQDQIAEAQKAYGNSNIRLNVAYTEGTVSVRNGVATIGTGLDANAVNIFVSRTLPPSKAGMAGVSEIDDVAAVIVNFDKVSNGRFITINTTAHELGHHFIGDVYRSKRVGIPGHFQSIARDVAVNTRLRFQALGFNQQPFREVLTHRVYAVPLNSEANEPRQ